MTSSSVGAAGPSPCRFHTTRSALLLRISNATISGVDTRGRLMHRLLSSGLPRQLGTLRRHHDDRNLSVSDCGSRRRMRRVVLRPIVSIGLLPMRVISTGGDLCRTTRAVAGTKLGRMLVEPLGRLRGVGRASRNANRLLNVLASDSVYHTIDRRRSPTAALYRHCTGFGLHAVGTSSRVNSTLLAVAHCHVRELPIVSDGKSITNMLKRDSVLTRVKRRSRLVDVRVRRTGSLPDLSATIRLVNHCVHTRRRGNIGVNGVDHVMRALGTRIFAGL